MKPQYNTCALVGHFADPRVSECAQALVAYLNERHLTVLVSDEARSGNPPAGAESVAPSALATRAQFMICIGGDGTLLQAASLLAGTDVPLLGINRGRLGFLTDVLIQDMTSSLDAVLEGQCTTDRRPLLEAHLRLANGTVRQHYALNDVVLLRRETGRLLDFKTEVGGRYVNSHSGDGLVIATATGSTAYALSCGGPIVDPQLNVLVVVPVCPHTLSDRPIVIPGDSQIEVRLSDRGEGHAEVTCDATLLGAMEPEDRLLVRSAGRSITLLHPPGYDYYRLLRSKLHWGRGDEAHER